MGHARGRYAIRQVFEIRRGLCREKAPNISASMLATQETPAAPATPVIEEPPQASQQKTGLETQL